MSGDPARFHLYDPGGTRLGWAAVALVCGGFALGGAWPALAGGIRPAGVAASLALAVLYGWVATGAIRLTFARSPRLTLDADGDSLVIEHDAVLNQPLAVPAAMIESATVDPRPRNERRVAAATKRSAVAPAGFVDARIPVVSAAPAAHWANGTGAAPNLVLRFHEPVEAAPPPRSVRLLLRLSGGRNSPYRGPRPGRRLAAVRLVVADGDVPALAAALEERGVALVASARDEAYLGPLTARHHRRFARDRWVMAAVVAGTLGVAMVVGLLSA